ncbi:MAG: SET domain-containing protein-lysine N-methyltransferase [Verrucomicrobia bacterium]|nr:SET domain-containing protein-lysine N-methyltransferase [Verrucomicrobiota bacterium]
MEKRIPFTYVHQIAFENEEDHQEILKRGLEKEKRGEVSGIALELGALHIDKILGGYIPDVSVRWINDQVGYGLFAEEDIPEGAYVGEYTGIVHRNDRRYFEPLNNYYFEYPVPDEIGRSFVINALQGNLTRFINHSSAPNLRPVHVFYGGYYHLIFLAKKEIKKGEQLCFDYGPSYWYIRDLPQSLTDLA